MWCIYMIELHAAVNINNQPGIELKKEKKYKQVAHSLKSETIERERENKKLKKKTLHKAML